MSADDMLAADQVDVAHLLVEHRAATAELRRLRSVNAELHQQIDGLEGELLLCREQVEELEAILGEADQ